MSRTRTALLAIIAVLIAAIAGLSGYMYGFDQAEKQFIADNPSSATAIKAKLDKVKPGTGAREAEALPNGTYDATIQGPGGELKTREDIQKIHRRNPQDPFAIGAIDAPLVISEFSDFECPFCARYTTQTEPSLIKDYVDKGLVRIEWNDLPINGPNAVAAAKAGRAAAEQGKFHEFKEALFAEAATKDGHPGFGAADFERFAVATGVPDLEKFKADAASNKYDAAVEQASQYGGGIGISGTPGFVIGSEFLAGAQPLEAFETLISQQLAATVS